LEFHRRRPCWCWDAASVPNWEAKPGVGDLLSLHGAASYGYLAMEGVRPLHVVVPLLEMLQRQKHLKTRLLLNGYPRNRCETHIGGCRMEEALLLQAHMPPRLPRTEFLDEVGTWRAAGDLGAELDERLTAVSGILFRAPRDIAHLRTTVECGVQPAHTDAWEPRLQHKDVPS